MKSRKPDPAIIDHKNMRFLITDRPTDATMDKYIEELTKHKVTDVVRVCEPTYDTHKMEHVGIAVLDWAFDDGSPPPNKIVDDWFQLLKKRFSNDEGNTVAVHCVAGLGRAPVLVALALIESGMKYEDAVEVIRSKRRGAINAKQLVFLSKYKSKSRLKLKNGGQKGCNIQ